MSELLMTIEEVSEYLGYGTTSAIRRLVEVGYIKVAKKAGDGSMANGRLYFRKEDIDALVPKPNEIDFEAVCELLNMSSTGVWHFIKRNQIPFNQRVPNGGCIKRYFNREDILKAKAMRENLPLTLEQIGKYLGLTREGVRQRRIKGVLPAEVWTFDELEQYKKRA